MLDKARRKTPKGETFASSSLELCLFFFFFFLPDYALNYCRFGLNLGLIITKPSESADVTMREPGNKGWNESRNGRGIE